MRWLLGSLFSPYKFPKNVPHANVKGNLINATYNLDEGLMQNKTAWRAMWLFSFFCSVSFGSKLCFYFAAVQQKTRQLAFTLWLFFFKGDTSFLLISVIKPLYYFDNAEGLQFPVSLHITFKRLFNADDVGFTGTRASLTFQSKSAAIDTWIYRPGWVRLRLLFPKSHAEAGLLCPANFEGCR